MSTGQHNATILVVDDEEDVRNAITDALSREGYDIIGSPNAPDAMMKVIQIRFDVAILDILMPDMSGFELMRAMSKLCPETILIALTGMLDPGDQFSSTAESTGVFAYMKKPCKLQDLKDTLKKALDHKHVFK